VGAGCPGFDMRWPGPRVQPVHSAALRLAIRKRLPDLTDIGIGRNVERHEGQLGRWLPGSRSVFAVRGGDLLMPAGGVWPCGAAVR
jgi:hypothetical protein